MMKRSNAKYMILLLEGTEAMKRKGALKCGIVGLYCQEYLRLKTQTELIMMIHGEKM